MSTSTRRPERQLPSGAAETLPRHLAIIMDGNGRWARSLGRPRSQGHLEGAESVRAITRECTRLGLRALTLYAFSTENWRRPRLEVNLLMRILSRYLVEERREIMENGVQLSVIGDTDALPAAVRRELDQTMEMSRKNEGLILTLALNYGGRQEILRAVQRIAGEVQAGKLKPEAISTDMISSHLDTAGLPDPDLLIRTGGEMRLSGFLLWQIEYSEIWVTKTPWPKFRVPQLHAAFHHYAARVRRYGGLVG